MKVRPALLALIIPPFVVLLSSCTRTATSEWSSGSSRTATDSVDVEKLPVIEHKNYPLPQTPPPVNRNSPARVKIHLEVKEQVGRLADGVEYTFWTFGGSVPGPMFRIREGDYVDFTLANHPDNKVPHNIDLHAVTGPGGGAEGSFTAPGHSSTFSFRALNPGVYVYHCATAPVGMHVANGMYGLIVVEPREGWPKVDREYYVVQGDFYTEGAFGERGLQAFDMKKAIREEADYVVFNGAVGAIAGENSLKAEPGEKVRIFIGNGGPNLSSSFHVIGEVFDKVYPEGNTKMVMENVQTTVVPPGGAAIVEFRIDTPGSYTLVDHALFRAFNKGALGQLHVDGDYNPRIYTGKRLGEVYLPEGQAVVPISQGASVPEAATLESLEARIKAGEIVYRQNCAACHQPNGTGLAGAFPPLAGSDYLMADEKRAIKVVLNGLEGSITVNGQLYNSVMPALGLSESDVASVVTYIRNSWGNKGGLTTLQKVKDAK
jgi:nitrite reductase (NO-forming)